jgi:ubiquinone/menaquinone biosynthesis C-methylase UbiE
MKAIKTLLAKSVATQLVGASFSLPGLLEKKSFLRTMDRIFSSTAPSYDRIWERMGKEPVILAPLEKAFATLSVRPGRILDLACGTGSATLRMAEEFPESTIIGADLSEQMIRTFKKKSKERERPGLLPLVSQSGRTPFGDGTFDLVVTQNAPPYLEEMIRVLRPGGSLFLLYSFVIVDLVHGVIRRRLEALQLIDIAIEKAEEGIAVTARKEGKPTL